MRSDCLTGQRVGQIPVAVLLLFWFPFLPITSVAVAEESTRLPSVAELLRAHERLRDDVREVQGEIEIFRIEKAVPEALTSPPEELGITRTHTARFWRSGDRLRVDYTTYHGVGDQPVPPRKNSLAIDGTHVYSLSEDLSPEVGMMRVCTRESGEGADLLNYADHTFLQALDVLWRAPSANYLDVLKRPDATLLFDDDESSVGGILLRAAGNDGSATFGLRREEPHPIVSIKSDASAGGVSAGVQVQINSARVAKRWYPTRIAEVARFGADSGYTRVVTLKLEPLTDRARVETPFTIDSFRDLGIGFQVFEVGDTGREKLGTRVQRPAPVRRDYSLSPTQKMLLWLNGAFLVGAAIYLVRRHRQDSPAPSTPPDSPPERSDASSS